MLKTYIFLEDIKIYINTYIYIVILNNYNIYLNLNLNAR